MDRLTLMDTFVKVAEMESFSQAADRLGLSRSVVSKYVSALEDHLGVRLVNRTTRRLSLTEVGEAYRLRCQTILADLEEADRAVGALHGTPSGTLRVNAPMSFGFLHLAPAIPALLAAHPTLSVDMDLNDRFVDLVSDGFDVAVRIGSLPDSSLIATRLAPLRLVVCASPAYLARRGEPKHPRDLEDHECLIYTLQRFGEMYPLVHLDGTRADVAIRGRFKANNGDAIRAATLGGAGICISPTFLCGDDLRDGRLVRVLPDWVGREMGINAVYPHNRHLSAKVRVFVDHLRQWCGKDPYWDQDLGFEG
ncbi:MAG: LysR family transcriptional regulator [Rhodospirillum sp.]|nr:LysR family transcriptional regulator [Rhodospirillum sp.]MCF8489755.1 LysR family transcriptional regulator [Rhodospirillum sp.]MCF8502469.1 LysR family transcriptional regulator [Rhodospirillum sp.]